MQQQAVFKSSLSLPRTHTKYLVPTIVCILGTMFYLYEFVLQVSPSVMTSHLMRDFQLNAAGLGAMSAFYYYAYTPMQLPGGLLYDRFGPRILMSFAIVVCAIGALLFSMTHSVALASASRFLIGFGSAFSFTGALLLISRWFPPQYFAWMAGLVQLMSSIGAIMGQIPLADAIERWGWRGTLFWIGVSGIVLASLVWLIVRDSPSSIHANSQKPQIAVFKGLRQICQHSQTWYIALYSFLIWAPIVAFAALWGIPFLVEAYGISTKAASTACAMIWLGIGIGSPLIGWFSDRVSLRCLPLTAVALIGFVASFVILYFHVSLILLFIGLFLFGFASAGQSLSFGIVKDRTPQNVIGTAIGFNNMAVVAGGALFQPLVGLLLHLHSSGEIIKGVPVYSVNDFQVALLLVPTCYLLAALVSVFMLKETFCKQQYEY